MEKLIRHFVDYGVSTLAYDMATGSGDKYLVQSFDQGVLLALIDGLGHGPPAAEAAGIAVQVLKEHAGDPVITLTNRCHRALRLTRGAAMSLACVDLTALSMTWIGVGNVSGLLVRAASANLPEQEALLMRAGVVGHTLPALRVAVVPVFLGDTLIFITDGVAPAFTDDIGVNGTPQNIADHILRLHNKGTDDATVLVVRFGGEGV